MEIENIIEICVAIDIAILGIAYPIIVDKTSNIGDRYNSNYISVLFEAEFPQKPVRLFRLFKVSLFQLILYATVITFLLLIFKAAPLFGWNNWWINNSASLLVLVASGFLTIFFFYWLDKVVLFNGKPVLLLKRIIINYNRLQENSQLQSYHLKAINEIALYAIAKQDEHIQETLLDFYSQLFLSIRQQHDTAKPLVYPIDLYFLLNRIHRELIDTPNKKLFSIEHRAVSGMWLLGEDFQNIRVSGQTYNWLWQNLLIICTNPKYVRMYWANANNYSQYQLGPISVDYDFEKDKITNQEQIDSRQQEINEFLEFHFALGGLLLYTHQYKTINYFFEFTESYPPRYVLLPTNMTTIFQWFEHFNNEFTSFLVPIDIKYPFPELDNLGSRRKIIFWICNYLCLLFIRQYSLHAHYVYQQFTALPQLPNEIYKLNNWLDSLTSFEYCLAKIIQEDELLRETDLTEVVNQNKQGFDNFIIELREAIKEKIGLKKEQNPLSEEKLRTFEQSTIRTINDGFGEYNSLLNHQEWEVSEEDLIFPINGGTILMSKSAFTDNDIPHMNYDSVLAEMLVGKIRRVVPDTFRLSRTVGYVLNQDNFIQGIEKIIENQQKVSVVGINLSYRVNNAIMGSRFKDIVKPIISVDPRVESLIYILHDEDLPSLSFYPLQQAEIDELKLYEVDAQLPLYASVLDLNLPENQSIKEKYVTGAAENQEPQVLVAIAFSCKLYWKKDREVIQLKIATPLKEVGIQSDISQIRPLTAK